MAAPSNFSNLFRVDGKVALITGGSRGIGFHTAMAFLLAGAQKVILVSRRSDGEEGLDQAVKKLNNLPSISGRAVAIAADVSKVSEIEGLISEAKKEVDRIDILVANAGATWGGPFEETPDWSNTKVLSLNVQSVFNLIKLTLPLLEKAGSRSDPSRIIIVGSVAGLSVPHIGQHGTPMYSASKAAVHHLGRNLALELGPRNITTNIIAPGFFPSKLANGMIEVLGGTDELSQNNPRRRLGEPEDIMGAMTFLCSPAGAYANGVTLVLDGGAILNTGRMNKM